METSSSELAKERKAYRLRKKAVMEKEAVNYSKVVILRSVKGYWVAVDHSAIILALVLAKPAKLRAHLIRDNDFQVKSKLGVVSLRSIDLYKTALPKTGLCKIIYEDDDYVIFELEKPLSEEEFTLLAKDEENKREFLRKEILKTCPLPMSICRLRELLVAFYRFSRKKGSVKEAQRLIYDTLDGLCSAYYELMRICRLDEELAPGIVSVLSKIDDAKLKMMILSELEVMSIENATVFHSRMIDVSFTLKKEAKKVGERKDPRNVRKN